MKLTTVTKLCFATGLSLTCSFAGTLTVGVASALGTFRVDDSKVEGNANIFDGSEISTEQASSRVYLHNGAVLTLGIYSSGVLYKDHVILKQGSAKVDGINSYSAQIGPIRLKGTEALSQAVIRLDGGIVQIATLAGTVNVLNSQGLLIRRVTAGAAAEFDETKNATPVQSGATAGQSGATADQTSAPTQTGAESAEEKKRRRRREAALYVTLGVALAGLGLATDAILQPGPAPTSP